VFGKEAGNTLFHAGLSTQPRRIISAPVLAQSFNPLPETFRVMARASSAPRRTWTRSPGSDQAGRSESEARITAP